MVKAASNAQSVSISHYACPETTGFQAFASLVSAHGFNGVALTARSFSELQLPVLKRVLGENRLTVSSVNSAGYFLRSDPDARAAQAQNNERLVQLSAEVGAHGLNVIAGGIGSVGSHLGEGRARVIDELHLLAMRAGTLGVTLIVEPVHPLGIRDKGCLNTIDQVLDAIADIENAAVTIDLFHSWWDPDLPRFLEFPASRIGLLQMCDVDMGGHDGTVRRVQPGAGSLEPEALVRTVMTTHPHVPLELEVFADQIGDLDLDRMLADTRKLLDAAQKLQS